MILDTGYCSFKVNQAPSNVIDNLRLMYQESTSNVLADFNVELKSQSLVRKFYKPQIEFFVGEKSPFKPVPAKQSYAFMEWSMNWCITALLSTELLIHAAVLEKNNQAIIFPAPPGSGKSTLTAYLMLNGWRLLSDEMAIINLSTLEVQPSVRPICLKNNSIDIVKAWAPQHAITKTITDTHKGNIAHVRPSDESFEGKNQPAKLVGIVYPQYQSNAQLQLSEMSMVENFTQLVDNAFNFDVIGTDAFRALQQITESCFGYRAQYSNLEQLETWLSEQVR